MMEDSTLIVALLEPLTYPLDPSKRIFWGCCFSSLLLASFAVAYRTGRLDIRGQATALLIRPQKVLFNGPESVFDSVIVHAI